MFILSYLISLVNKTSRIVVELVLVANLQFDYVEDLFM